MKEHLSVQNYNERKKQSSFLAPLICVILAITITSTMDANGLTNFSALPLFPLMAIFWYLGRYTKKDIGFTFGVRSDYLPAVLYPFAATILIAAVAFIASKTDLNGWSWRKNSINFLLICLTTVLVVLITEEGLFRGYLWSALKRSGLSAKRILLFTAMAFMLWHISVVSFQTGLNLPYWQIPIFLINVFLLGINWGLLRLISGSIIVSSTCHGVWNGLVYLFFGYGQTHHGALGITASAIFGPENGIMGIGVNLAVVLYLWRKVRQVKNIQF